MGQESDRQRFFGKFVRFLKSTCKDSVLMLSDNREWKFKNFSLVDELTAEKLTGIVDAWRFVSWSVGDAKAVTDSFLAAAKERQDNEDADYLELDLAEHKGDCKYWLTIANKLKSSLAIKKDQVKYKPIILVDIDLKDQEKVLKDGGFIAPSADAAYLKALPPEKKIKLLKNVCNLDLIVTETEPSLILFTGGGFHLWYTLEDETDSVRYKAVHEELCGRITGMLPDLVVDTAANHITQNIRLPFTYNGKYQPEVECQLIYEAQEFKTPAWLKTFHSKLDATTIAASGMKSMNLGSPDAFSIEGLLSVTTNRPKSRKEGLRNFRRDPRMWDFIQRYLTFEAICAYTMTPIKGGTKHNNPEKPGDYYLVCCSPLRKDNHPSFMVFNSGLFCKDLGLKERIYDFGTLMRLLLVQAKERLGFPSSETTRYEADFHCVFAAYFNYVQHTKTFVLPMIEMGSTAKKREENDTEFDPKLLKKVFPGKQYYCNMQVTFDTWVKRLRKEESWTPELLKSLLENTPDFYYFYDPKQANSPQSYLTNAVTLCILNYFNQLNLCIQFERPGKFNLFVVNRELQLHEPWSTWVVTHTITGHKEELPAKTAVQTFVVNANMSDAGTLPAGTPRLSDYCFGILSNMANMQEELGNYLPTTVVPDDELTVKKAVIRYLSTHILKGANISPCDIKLALLDNNRYIEFDNKLVLYSTEPSEYNKIGQCLEKSEKGALLRKSVVDLRINHAYEPGRQTPRFDQFVNDMTYDDNCFDKALRYFTASLLYSPRMHPGRVWFLLGRDGDNGKSVIGTIVAGLLGDRYVTTKDLSDLTSTTDKGKNTRNELLHSLLNVTQDSSRNKLEGVFKSLIEGEPVAVRALYKKEYDVCLPTHYMVNANSLPATWGETQPLVKRIVLTRVDRVVPKSKRIDNLGQKILNEEASGIWPRILKDAPKYLENGINGFLTPDEIGRLNSEFYEQSEVFCFIRDYTYFNPEAEWSLTGKQFKVLYNKYRSHLGKQAVTSDNLISEAESFIRKIYSDRLTENALDKGFSYRKGTARGLPLRVFVPPKSVGNYSPIDSEADGTEPPDEKFGNF